MTVASQNASVTRFGNGATTAFTYDFLIPDEEDVLVYLTEIATGSMSTVSAALYSITGINDPDGGIVTYPLAGTPLTSAYAITIARRELYTQPYDFINQSRINFNELEQAFDRVVRLIQQQGDESNITAVENLILLDIGPRLEALEDDAGANRSFNSYGAEGDGVTDDTTAFMQALGDDTVNVLYGKPGSVYRLPTAISITRTRPLIVDLRGSTIDASDLSNTGILWSFSGTVGTAKPLTADAAKGSLSIAVDDSDGVDIIAGDFLFFVSDEEYASGVSNGELIKVESVSTAAGTTTVVLESPLPYRLRTADNAEIYRVSLHPQVVIRNGKMLGNSGGVAGSQTAVRFLYCDRPIFQNFELEGFDAIAIDIRRSWAPWVENCYIHECYLTGVGILGCYGPIVSACKFESLQNGVAFGNIQGITRKAIISNNINTGTRSGFWFAAASDETLVLDNQIEIGEQSNNSVLDGIKIEGASALVADNIIKNVSRHGISALPLTTMTGVKPSFLIKNNEVTLGAATNTNGRQGVMAASAAAHSVAPDFILDGNKVVQDAIGVGLLVKAGSSNVNLAVIRNSAVEVSGTDGTSDESSESRTGCMIRCTGAFTITSAVMRANDVSGSVDGSAFYVHGANSPPQITRAVVAGNQCGAATIGVHVNFVDSLLYPQDNDTSDATTEATILNTTEIRPFGDGVAVFVDKAEMDAQLGYPAFTKGEVWADAVDANNGIYQKQGAIGAGSWTKIADLPQQIAQEALDTASHALAIAGAATAPGVYPNDIGYIFPFIITSVSAQFLLGGWNKFGRWATFYNPDDIQAAVPTFREFPLVDYDQAPYLWGINDPDGNILVGHHFSGFPIFANLVDSTGTEVVMGSRLDAPYIVSGNLYTTASDTPLSASGDWLAAFPYYSYILAVRDFPTINDKTTFMVSRETWDGIHPVVFMANQNVDFFVWIYGQSNDVGSGGLGTQDSISGNPSFTQDILRMFTTSTYPDHVLMLDVNRTIAPEPTAEDGTPDIRGAVDRTSPSRNYILTADEIIGYTPLVSHRLPASGHGQTPGESFCNYLQQELVDKFKVNARVIAFNNAVGGCTIRSLGKPPVADPMPHGDPYDEMLLVFEKCKELSEAEGRQIYFLAVLFGQGNSDGSYGNWYTDAAAMINNANTDIKAVNNQLGNPIWLFNSSTFEDVNSVPPDVGGGYFAAIGYMQLHDAGLGYLASVGGSVPQAFGTEADKGHAGDHLHLNPQGYTIVGEYEVDQLLRVLAGDPITITKAISAVAVGSNVTLTFQMETPPLVLDTTTITDRGNKGVRVYDAGNNELTVNSVTLLDGAAGTVSVVCASGIPAYVDIGLHGYVDVDTSIYVQAEIPRANIRDSTATPSRADFAASQPKHQWAHYQRINVT